MLSSSFHMDAAGTKKPAHIRRVDHRYLNWLLAHDVTNHRKAVVEPVETASNIFIPNRYNSNCRWSIASASVRGPGLGWERLEPTPILHTQRPVAISR
jgi:hypothetical protein